MTSLSRGLLAVLCASALLAPSSAVAAPTTVDLRIEGPTRTLFEGQVTTDVRTFRFTGESTEHRCDGNPDDSAGPTPNPVPTRGAAIATASEQAGFAIAGQWFDGLGASFEEIAGESVAFDAGTNRYLVEYENWQPAQTGACGDDIAGGDQVLFAYGTGAEPLLRLTAPATARPGEAFLVRVVDGATGAPVAGASVGGGVTDASGNAAVATNQRGVQGLKADKPGTIRSNAAQVCVTDGADGFCGTRTPEGQTFEAGVTGPATVADRTKPFAAITSIREGRVFRRRRAPRVLRGRVADEGGVQTVKLRLTRRAGRRCFAYSGRRERFVRRPKRRCGARHGWWFKVADSAEWEYQLARRLPRGRYVLDVNAIDRSFNRDDERRRGTNRVVFRVR